ALSFFIRTVRGAPLRHASRLPGVDAVRLPAVEEGPARISAYVRSNLCAIEVHIRTRRSRSALVLISRAVHGGAIRMLRGGTSPEQAQLTYLHPRPQLDRQRRYIRQLQRDVPGEARVDPPCRRMRQQAEPAEAGVMCRDEGRTGQEKAGRVGHLYAPNWAQLVLAHVDDGTEGMGWPRLEPRCLPLQPEHLEPRRELHLERWCLLDSVERCPLL